MIPDATETRKLAEYNQKLKDFESISKALQGSGEKRVKRINVFQARELLERVVEDYGTETVSAEGN